MNVEPDLAVSRIAAAIGEPARARMLYSLLDGRARTSTELAVIGGVTPATASVHLNRLREARLVGVTEQGKHRYYCLAGADVAAALEGLSVVAGFAPGKFTPNTPLRLREARTCYDHIAGRLGVRLRSRFHALGWITGASGEYELTPTGTEALESLGIDIRAARALRRKFAYPCLDWSERQPHIGGALGSALLNAVLRRKWVIQDLDSRSLQLTKRGRSEIAERFGIVMDDSE